MNADDLTLPELTDQRVDEIETALFARIAAERRDELATARRDRTRAVRRGRVWMGATAAASLVAVAAIIAPQLGGGTAGSATIAQQPVTAPENSTIEPFSLQGGAMDAGGATDSAGSLDGSVARGTAASAGGADVAAREIVATASATVRVDDASTAADAITAAAVAAGGYVESLSLGGGETTTAPTSGSVSDGMMIDPQPTGAWITVRVPADRLESALAGLSSVGEVTASQVDRRDVTTEAVDLRARVASLEASVARLTDLMAQATSTGDLIAAESALADRQSQLESLRQQLTWIDSQVDMSTLTVTLTEPAPAATTDPAGFGDGLAAGWNGLVAALGGLIVGVGFLLPWVAVVAVIALVVWAIRRAVVRGRARRAAAAAAVDGQVPAGGGAHSDEMD